MNSVIENFHRRKKCIRERQKRTWNYMSSSQHVHAPTIIQRSHCARIIRLQSCLAPTGFPFVLRGALSVSHKLPAFRAACRLGPSAAHSLTESPVTRTGCHPLVPPFAVSPGRFHHGPVDPNAQDGIVDSRAMMTHPESCQRPPGTGPGDHGTRARSRTLPRRPFQKERASITC